MYWEDLEGAGGEGGGRGIGMGNTCKPMAVSFQCMTKFTTKKKCSVLWGCSYFGVHGCPNSLPYIIKICIFHSKEKDSWDGSCCYLITIAKTEYLLCSRNCGSILFNPYNDALS